MDITKIRRAFKPSSEIQEPRFFSGRKEEIREGIISLSEGGSFIVVNGLRGVGKSSIAKQIKLIAEGSTELPELFNLDRLIPNKGFDFITLYHTCDSFVLNVHDLIKRLIFGDNNNPSLLEYTKTGDKRLEQIIETYKAEGSANLLGVKLGGTGEEKRTYSTSLSDDLIHQFKQILGIIRKDNLKRKGLLFIIDEFDVLKDKSGFASLVKTCSNDFVKFMVVGISSSISELIEDHSSISRQLRSIEVKKMYPEELWGILVNAERYLGKEIEFTDNSAQMIVNKSDGFPYFTHLLGSEALLNAFENGSSSIDEGTMEYVFKKITSGKLKTTYEETYHKAVKNSPQREILLRWFAEDDENVINSEKVYSVAKEYGVTNPSQLMKELTNFGPQAPGVLTKVREKHYRFTDPVFKVYAKMRTWKF
ncbi:MAG: hypothetical protein ACEPOZ_21230 [Marinifilaceae bacterium]